MKPLKININIQNNNANKSPNKLNNNSNLLKNIKIYDELSFFKKYKNIINYLNIIKDNNKNISSLLLINLIEDFQNRLLNSSECKSNDSSFSNNRGASGVLIHHTNYSEKITDLINKEILNEYEFYKHDSVLNMKLIDYINRFNNYELHIRSFLNLSSLKFPDNFLKVSNFLYCYRKIKDENVALIKYRMIKNTYMKTHQIKNMTEMIQQKLLTKEDILSISLQLYIIFYNLNSEKLYHTDLKPANILISKSSRIIKYYYNDSYYIVNKDDYIPIIIDYDLVNLKSRLLLSNMNNYINTKTSDNINTKPTPSDYIFYINSFENFIGWNNPNRNLKKNLENLDISINDILPSELIKSSELNKTPTILNNIKTNSHEKLLTNNSIQYPRRSKLIRSKLKQKLLKKKISMIKRLSKYKQPNKTKSILRNRSKSVSRTNSRLQNISNSVSRTKSRLQNRTRTRTRPINTRSPN